MIGTSPNEGVVIRMDRPVLYILSAASPGDPLDCVGQAAPLLAEHYSAIQWVGPDQDMSLRSLRRLIRPGVDRVLHDFTLTNGEDWALEMLDAAPGAVLMSGLVPAQIAKALSNLRSAQRYATGTTRLNPAASIGALEIEALGWDAQTLRRPAPQITARDLTDDVALAVGPGAIEAAYAALLGLVDVDASLVILAANRRDANDLTDIVDAVSMSQVRVRYIRNRRDVISTACSVGGLIDAIAERGAGNAAFVARCVGAPVLTLTTASGAREKAADFAAARPDRDAAAAQDFCDARPIAAFAGDLYALIEDGHRRAKLSVAAA